MYGLTRSYSGTPTTRQGFVGGLGHESDETGLIYMRHRYCDPSTGRFISEDQKRDGENWFTYAGNNPVNEVDQTGCNIVLIIGALAVLVAAIVGGIAECLADGWNWPNFWRGAGFAAATTLAGLLGGLVAGAIVGAFTGWLDAYLTGGNQVAGALLSGAFGAVGGAVAVPAVAGLSGVLAGEGAKQVAIFLLLGVDGGAGQGAAGSGAALFD